MKTSALGCALTASTVLQPTAYDVSCHSSTHTAHAAAPTVHMHFVLVFCHTADLLATGMAISSLPKNTFWKPDDPGCTTHATDGVLRPADK
jgi:hypothetical protein